MKSSEDLQCGPSTDESDLRISKSRIPGLDWRYQRRTNRFHMLFERPCPSHEIHCKCCKHCPTGCASEHHHLLPGRPSPFPSFSRRRRLQQSTKTPKCPFPRWHSRWHSRSTPSLLLLLRLLLLLLPLLLRPLLFFPIFFSFFSRSINMKENQTRLLGRQRRR